MSLCACMGPMPGQTLCPCALRGVAGSGSTFVGFAVVSPDESERVLDELEALAAAEAQSGDARALRHVQRLRAQLVRKPRPMHEDNGN